MILCKLFILALVGYVATSSHLKRWEEMEVKDERPGIRDGWVDEGAAPQDAILNMHIALKQHRFEELLDHLHEISDPMHVRCAYHIEDIHCPA